MAVGNPNFGNLYSTSVDNYTDELKDNYTANSKLLDWLKKSGNVVTEDGGVEILQNLEIAENGAYNRYDGAQAWDLESKKFATAASFARKKIAVTMVVTGSELMANEGKSRMIDLIAAKIKNGAKTLQNGMAADVYSDGSDPMQIGGLRYLVSDTPSTGVVGGIDASDADNEFWRNYKGACTFGTDSVVEKFNEAIISTTRNNDAPKAVFVDNAFYTNYYKELQAQQRFVSADGKGGFMELAINGLPIFCDQGIVADPMEGKIPANHAYFLNTDFIYLRPHVRRNPAKKERVNSINQDLYSEAWLWAGNLTTSGRAFQGVVVGS
ncbi:MAG: phage major capsid protein [Alphaproteobacteria bacterium]|nr:phage major capsid protein [Alphaproteobacteria bacterium]MBO7066586.1 phage major capsid protein [Alphaproteobacteria bacterium]